MSIQARSRAPIAAGTAFAVLAVAGNALQGSTPALHGDAGAVVRFYSAAPTRIAVAMMLSLASVFFLSVFLAAFGRALDRSGAPGGWAADLARVGSTAAVALLAGGFALNSAGALRGWHAGPIAPEAAVVFYEGGLALSGLAAPVAMAALLAGTALVALRAGGPPRWFGWTSAALAVVGVVSPVSFVLMLLFPFWVLAGCAVLARQTSATDAEPVAAGYGR